MEIFVKKETYILVSLIASCSLGLYHWIFHRVVHNAYTVGSDWSVFRDV